jgi:hypothetical protein
MSQRTDHFLVPLAQWKPRGSDIPGEMKGCTSCGLVVIADRRGTMLIYGGVGAVHKHLAPTQGVPPCVGSQASVAEGLNGVVRDLAAKHDPRFEFLRASDGVVTRRT